MLDLECKVTTACFVGAQMYAQQPTGIAPERVKQMKMDLTMTDTKEYILRPEAMESFWYANTHLARAVRAECCIDTLALY
eukprot:COSAG04_NODE_768_length_10460_cov_6.967378_5_plen_80_part_00